MKYFGLLILAAICLCCTGAKHTRERLAQAEALIETYPDSALLVLREIAPVSYDRKGTAKHSLLLSIAYDKNCIDLKSDSVIRPAVNYYSNRGNRYDRARMYYYYGAILKNMGNNDLAMDAFLQAQSLSQDLDNDYLKALIASKIGFLHYSQNNCTEAIESYRTSADYFARAGKTRNEGLMYTHIGKAYFHLTEFDKTLESYIKSKEILESADAVQDVLMMSSNIAALYFYHLGEPQKALNQIFSDHGKYNGGRLTVYVLPILSYIYESLGEQEKAHYYANLYLQAAPKKEMKERVVTLTLLKKMAVKRNDTKSALEYADRLYSLTDSIHLLEKEQSIVQIENRFRNKELAMENEALRRTNILRLAISGLVLLTLGFLLFRLVKNRKRTISQYEQKLEEVLLTAEKLQQERDNIQTALSEKLNVSIEKENRLKQALERRLMQVSTLMEKACLYENTPFKFMEVFKSEMKKLDEDFSADLQEVVDYKYHHIVSYLKSEHPGLKRKDVDLCCFICLGWSVAEISMFYGLQHSNSIYNRRAELRKHMNFKGSIQLDTYIRSVIAKLAAEEQKKAKS